MSERQSELAGNEVADCQGNEAERSGSQCTHGLIIAICSGLVPCGKAFSALAVTASGWAEISRSMVITSESADIIGIVVKQLPWTHGVRTLWGGWRVEGLKS